MERIRTYEWANPLDTAARAKEMSGFEFLNSTLQGTILPSPIAVTIGIKLIEVRKGKVIMDFEPQEYHYNPIGSVHGGVISTVLDSVMGCTVHSRLPQGTGYTTLELKVNFIRPITVKSGKIKSTGKIIHLGKTTALVEANLEDEAGKVYAHGVSTCMIFPI